MWPGGVRVEARPFENMVGRFGFHSEHNGKSGGF